MIPSDLWFPILTLLPVKSLLKLRSVSKSFLSIIDDSNFISSHLRRFPDNLRETRFLSPQPGSNRPGYEILEINNPAIIQIEEPCLQTGVWSLEGTLDGLILLSYENSSRIAVVWNPSVKKHRQLSFSSEVVYFGLGYSHLCNDYKVISMSKDRDQAWLYSLKSDSLIDLPDSGFHRKFGECTAYSKGLSFEQGIVWIELFVSVDGNSYHNPRLAWFDFGTEKFRYSDEMPCSLDQNSLIKDDSNFVILDGGSTMGVWGVDDNNQVLIWALETDMMTWTKRYEISRYVLPLGFHLRRLRFIERNGVLMLTYSTNKDGNLHVLSYDIELQTIKHHEKFSRLAGSISSYCESLIMLK